MYPLFFLFFSMRKERITCTPTRKKRGRLLCGVHLLTSFVYTSGLLRKSRVDFSRPKIYWIATACVSLHTLLYGRCLGFCFTKSRNSLHYVVAHLTFRYFGVPLRFSLHKIRKKKPSNEGCTLIRER